MSVQVMYSSSAHQSQFGDMTLMEVEESPQYVQDIYVEDPAQCLEAITRLKNIVIGSNRQKAICLRHGILPRVLSLLGDGSREPEIRREACVVLGSLVKGTPENVRAVVDACSVPILVGVFSTNDELLIEYALHCLTTIMTFLGKEAGKQAPYSHEFAPKDVIYSDPDFVPRLLGLMHHSVLSQTCVATILSNACSNSEQQHTLATHGVIPSLGPLLLSPDFKVQMPAITCLTALSFKNPSVSAIIAETFYENKKVPDLLAHLLSRDKPPRMQLALGRCLTNLHRANAISSTDPKITLRALPCLVRLCSREHDNETRILAAETLSYLIEVDKDLQLIASISNRLIPTLTDYLKCQPILSFSIKNTMSSSASMYQAAYKTFASLAANDEGIRKRIIEQESLVERVVSGLDDQNEQVALAALRCLHSLSRSVQLLRTTFKDHTVWKPLMKLLQHPNHDMLNVASSTLCNLLLEFSPSKEPILEAGGIEILCNLTRREDSGLRLNGIWALMNVAFQADQKVKSQILSSLGTDQIFRLLSDEEVSVVMKTLGLLRNLLSTPHIDHIMDLYGKHIMQAVILILEGELCFDVKEQALCMLANIADGFTAKDFIMTNEDVLKKITSYLNHASPKLQTAAVLCVSNLAWKDEEGSVERQAKLKELGVQKLLHSLITTTNQNLFDRVKTALNQFSPN